MKIPKGKFLLSFLLIAIILGIYVIYRMIPPPRSQIQEIVTGDVWANSTYKVEVPPSYAKIENGVFEAMAYERSADYFGASLFQQGDSPHGWWNLTKQNPEANLRKNITIYRDKDQPTLMLDFTGKRAGPIEWFSDDPANRGNNVGILLVGDIGLGYYNHDNSTPRALFIDIWLDTNPAFTTTTHWQGVKGVENDYHSGYPVQNMSIVSKIYDFDFRVDTYIRDSLNHWGLASFKLKMVQIYIEAEASSASIEVSKFALRTLN